MPTVKVKEARTCFVQEAKKLEKFGKANAIRHLVELEFPLSIFCRLWKYEEEGKVQKSQAVADQLAETGTSALL